MKNLLVLLLSSLFLLSSCGGTDGPQPERKQVRKTKVNPSKSPTTIKKDSSITSEAQYKDNIASLQREIEKLRVNSPSLVKSTYHPIRYDQVKEILALMYSMKVNQLKKDGLSDKALDSKYKSFYTIEYCDNRVLEELDKLAELRNKSTASRITIDYDKVFNDKAKGEDIVKFK